MKSRVRPFSSRVQRGPHSGGSYVFIYFGYQAVPRQALRSAGALRRRASEERPADEVPAEAEETRGGRRKPRAGSLEPGALLGSQKRGGNSERPGAEAEGGRSITSFPPALGAGALAVPASPPPPSPVARAQGSRLGGRLGPLAVAVPPPRYAARFVLRLAAPFSPRTGGAPAEVTARGFLPLTTPAPSRHGSAAPSTLASCRSAIFLTPYSPPPAAPRPHVLLSRSALPSLPASSSRRSILGLTEARELPGPRRPPAGVGRTPGCASPRPGPGPPAPGGPGGRRGEHPARERAALPTKPPPRAGAENPGGVPGADPGTLARWSWGDTSLTFFSISRALRNKCGVLGSSLVGKKQKLNYSLGIAFASEF